MQAPPPAKVQAAAGQLPAQQRPQQQVQFTQVQPWHSKDDTDMRQTMITTICKVFAAKKPHVSSDWREKLPNFVTRLEESLYRTAGSKEEYQDVNTLESRLQHVARNIVSRGNSAQNAQARQQQQQHINAQQHAAMQQQMAASNGFPAGAMQPGFSMGMATTMQQGSFQPGAPAPMVPQGSGGVGMAPGNPAQQQFAMQQGTMQGMVPGAAPGGYRVPQAGMPGPTQPGAMPSPVLPTDQAGASGYPQHGQPQQGAMMRTQATAPVMSNGAPVLLRNQTRDWNPNQGNGAMASGAGQAAPKMMPNGMPGQVVQGAMPGTQSGMMIPQTSAGMLGPGMVPVTQSMPMQQQQQQQQQQVVGQQQTMPGMVPVSGLQQQPQPGSGILPMGNMVPVNAVAGSNPAAAGGMQQPTAAGAVQGGQFQGGMIPTSATQGVQPGAGDAAAGGDQPGSRGSNANSVGSAAASTQGAAGAQAQPNRNTEQQRQYILKQQRWLIFLRHCAKCKAQGDTCPTYGQNCMVAKQLWEHLVSCRDPQCQYPRCHSSRELLKHHQKCTSTRCPVCVPVKAAIHKQKETQLRAHHEMMMRQQQYMVANGQVMMQQPQPGMGPGAVPSPTLQMGQVGMSGSLLHQHPPNGIKTDPSGGMMMIPVGPNPAMAAAGHPAQQQAAAYHQHQAAMAAAAQQQMKRNASSAALQQEYAAKRARTTVDQNNAGTSLLEAFTAEDIRTHLYQLLHPNQPVPKGDHLASLRPPIKDDNICYACQQTRLTFEPPSLYCTCCGQRIKRNQVYYTTPAALDAKGYWCHPCFNEFKGDKLEVEGATVLKAAIEKKKNDEELEEPWVQCDKCEGWVHQICALFNKGRNDNEVPYHCPWCLLEGVERGQRQRITVRPQAMLDARDLPTCHLSNFLEERLNNALQAERVERAKSMGVPPESVVTAEGLVVRVINNVSKVLEVKQKFYDAFKVEGHPATFNYKQKVVILYQRLDGVDIALYCLYVQEFGEDNAPPNKRVVYLSYLDSVKYFRPEDISAAGRNCALRTVVYHELLVGYLAYIKAHGYNAFYIWACPPLQGDDYILYCHPTAKQKTPSSVRLREWYHVLLRKAKEEGIVTYVSNLWDTYFEGGKDHKMDKTSAKDLPYFDGDYWPGEAEVYLSSIQEDMRVAGKKGNKAGGGSGKARSKGTKGKRYGADPTTTDEQLMGRLGEVVQGMKEDFIVVHLREPCSFCRKYINGQRFYHPSPPRTAVSKERTFEGISLDNPGSAGARVQPLGRFQLCEECYNQETMLGGGGGADSKLPQGILLADLRAEHVEPIPQVTDHNPIMESEFFDTRSAFLSLCQGNHYQFDTLRRAKHSSMMVLYHLHNPNAPGFACTCNTCGAEIEPGMGWRCVQCADFDQCTACKNNPERAHPHPLQSQVRKLDETRQRLTDEDRMARMAQLQRTLQLLEHSSGCNDDACQSIGCRRVKQLFQHAISCPHKVQGNCVMCRRMWALIRTHSSHCNNMECPVPRCKDFRAAKRRETSRAEDKRRQAYHQMLRAQQQKQSAGVAY